MVVKSRILVTNSIIHLPRVDHIIVLDDGCISEAGTYEELISHQGVFADFITTYLNEHPESEDEEAESKGI